MLLLPGNSRTASPAHEKKSPASISFCNLFERGFTFAKKRIIRTGIIRALETNPGQKTDWFRRMMQIIPIKK
jgi:hypothetical protein